MTNPHVGHALDCVHARALIDRFLLDELGSADAARLGAHVEGCAACTTEIGSLTRVLGLLGSLPIPRPTPDLDERILLAALDDRAHRRAHRSWLSDLRTQVLRGAMRTTGTLIATILSVALLGGAFVFAASQFFPGLPFGRGGGTAVAPLVTPTLEPATTTAASPQPENPTPRVIVITPPPTSAPTPEPTVAPLATSEPTPVATPEPAPEATPEPLASPAPTPQPTPTPTEKPRRTPPPSASPLPSESAAPTAEPTPSP